MRAVFAVIVIWAASGCSSGPTSTEGLCVAVVNVHGSWFSPSSAPSVPPDSVGSTPYLTVARGTGCLDQGEPADPLGHGESNFLV